MIVSHDRRAGRGNALLSMASTLTRTNAPGAVILIRILVGAVFLEEGIQKFLFPELLGEGRLARIGIPLPHLTGPFVGAVEVVCGALLLGLLTRVAALLLFVSGRRREPRSGWRP